MDRSYSLKRNKEFQRVYRRGQHQGARHMALVVCTARHGSVRVGFSVGKKVGNAVVRNKVKRRLRDAFSRQLEGVKTRRDYIVIARPSAAEASFRELQSTLHYLLKKTDSYVSSQRTGTGK